MDMNCSLNPAASRDDTVTVVDPSDSPTPHGLSGLAGRSVVVTSVAAQACVEKGPVPLTYTAAAGETYLVANFRVLNKPL